MFIVVSLITIWFSLVPMLAAHSERLAWRPWRRVNASVSARAKQSSVWYKYWCTGRYRPQVTSPGTFKAFMLLTYPHQDVAVNSSFCWLLLVLFIIDMLGKFPLLSELLKYIHTVVKIHKRLSASKPPAWGLNLLSKHARIRNCSIQTETALKNTVLVHLPSQFWD